MFAAILGKKIGMTQVYDDSGILHPVTVVQAGPCTVLQVKTVDTDGYNAMQLGFDDVKPQRARKPEIGHAAKAGTKPKRYVREFRLPSEETDVEQGQALTVEVFEEVPFVDVTGTSKGRGFSGGMRRHGFKGQLASHGVERKHRSPGSIASHSSNAGTGPKIKKGKRMAGQYGNTRCTTRNHKLVGVDKENNLLLIEGSVPGANGGYVMVRKSKTAKVK
ncbi:MAG: 50S ribosomal protein L3 [Phycisphaerae bacterium]